MGGLDHSFIKAYNPGAAAAVSPSIAEESVTGSVAAPVTSAASPRPAHAPTSSSRLKPPTPHARFGNSPATAGPQRARVSATPVGHSVISSPADSWMVSFSTLDAVATAVSPAAGRPSAAARSLTAGAPTSYPTKAQPVREPIREDAPPRPHLFQSTPLPEAEAFRPLLEVDHFLWPALIDDLAQRVAGPLRELAAEFSAASAAGCRTLLFVGDQPGCGVTSVLLAAARQLARHGLRVVMADANFARPDLARYLGIAAQLGWEDVMTRQAALAEALVESVTDQLTLLPSKGPVSLAESPLDLSLAPENLKQLRRHFDLVLVDGGALCDRSAQHLLERLGRGAIEGIVGIRDWRTARESLRIADPAASSLVERLQIGVIENFAA